MDQLSRRAIGEDRAGLKAGRRRHRRIGLGGVLLLPLLALLVAGFAPLSAEREALAQEATPAVAPVAVGLSRTDVRLLVPFTADGLNPRLTEAASVTGTCGFASVAALDRPDAWDCIASDNQVYDPCFENPYAAPDAAGTVACVESPFATEVVLLELTDPLAREKDATGPAPADLDPWALPWALELANGDRCTVLPGTLTVLAGRVAHYGCANGGTVLGETDRTQPVWTVSYLAEGALATSLVEVVVAWS